MIESIVFAVMVLTMIRLFKVAKIYADEREKERDEDGESVSELR